MSDPVPRRRWPLIGSLVFNVGVPRPGAAPRASRRRVLLAVLMVGMTMVVVAHDPAAASGGAFTDDDSNLHESWINAIAARGIAVGCGTQLYCPAPTVTRAQMASFLTRAKQLPPASRDYFTDDNGLPHEDAINRIAEAGITTGDAGGAFGPSEPVRRDQMTAFISRAFQLGPTDQDYFADDSGSLFEDSINRAAAAGITSGCSAEASLFCPSAAVHRDQMAAFLGRALGLAPSSNATAIVGTVLDELGQPLPRPTMYCVRIYVSGNTTDGGSTGDAAVALDGHYEIPTVPGTYKLVVFQCSDDSEYYPDAFFQEWYDDVESIEAAQVVTVEDGQQVRVDVRLAGGTYIYGRLTDTSGNPVAGANVAAYPAGDFRSVGFGVSLSDGRYRVVVPRGGAYQLSIYRTANDWRPEWFSAKGWQNDADIVNVETRRATTLADIRLKPTGDADGDGVPDWNEFYRFTCPSCYAPTNILDPDSDHDGVNDDTDPDPLVPN